MEKNTIKVTHTGDPVTVTKQGLYSSFSFHFQQLKCFFFFFLLGAPVGECFRCLVVYSSTTHFGSHASDPIPYPLSYSNVLISKVFKIAGRTTSIKINKQNNQK